jgi:hypothetical protein
MLVPVILHLPRAPLDVREKEAFDHWDNAEVFLNFVIFQEFDYAAAGKMPIPCMAA